MDFDLGIEEPQMVESSGKVFTSLDDDSASNEQTATNEASKPLLSHEQQAQWEQQKAKMAADLSKAAVNTSIKPSTESIGWLNNRIMAIFSKLKGTPEGDEDAKEYTRRANLGLQQTKESIGIPVVTQVADTMLAGAESLADFGGDTVGTIFGLDEGTVIDYKADVANLTRGISQGIDTIGNATSPTEWPTVFLPDSSSDEDKSYDTTSYERNRTAYDFAGDFVVLGKGAKLVSTAVSKTGPIANWLRNAGVSNKMIDKFFVNNSVLEKSSAVLKHESDKLVKAGVPITAKTPFNEATANMAKKVAPNIAKLVGYEQAALYASGYKHDVLFPEEASFMSKVLMMGVLPMAIGLGTTIGSGMYGLSRIYNRAALAADKELNDKLAIRAIQHDVGEHAIEAINQQNTDMLTQFGYKGSNTSEHATVNGYNEMLLNEIKNAELAEAKTANKPAITQHYDNLINDVRGKKRDIYNDLLSKNLKKDTESTQLAKDSIEKAQYNHPNVLQGVVEIDKTPLKQSELDDILAAQSKKRAKVEAEAAKISDPAKRANYLLENNYDNSDYLYDLIDADGNIRAANEVHIREVDSPEFSKTIKLATVNRVGTNNSQKINIITGKVSDDVFMKGDKYDIFVDETGLATLKRENGDQHLVSYSDTSANQYIWKLQEKMLQSSLSRTKDADGNLVFQFVANANKNGKFYLDLDNAPHYQLAYLEDLASRSGADSFLEAYNLKNFSRSVNNAKLLFSTDQPDLIQVLKARRLEATREFFINRQLDANTMAVKNSGQFTEDALLEELTGYTSMNESSGLYTRNNVVKDLINPNKSLAEVNNLLTEDRQYFRKNPNYLLAKRNDTGMITDKYNSEAMLNVAFENEMVMQGLTSNPDSLVTKITNLVVSSPQYKNNYLSSGPNSIGLGTDLLGSSGKLLLNKDIRQETNITNLAATSLENSVGPSIRVELNKQISPIVDYIRDSGMLKDPKATDEFAQFMQQSRNGFSPLDDGTTAGMFAPTGDGRWAIKLEGQNNLRVAEWHTEVGGVDQMQTTMRGYMPDINSGKPLIIGDKAKRLIELVDEFNVKVNESDNQLNNALGYEGVVFKRGHMPPKSLTGSEYIRVIGKTNDTGGFDSRIYIVGNTEKEANDLAKLQMTLGKLDEKGYSVKTAQELHINHKIASEDITKNYMQYVDYNDEIAQFLRIKPTDGVRKTGTSYYITGEAAYKELLNGLNRNLQQIATRTRSAIFRNQLSKAKTTIARMEVGSEGYNSMLDYITALEGRASPLGMNAGKFKDNKNLSSAIKSVYDGIDSIMDAVGVGVRKYYNLSEISRAQAFADAKAGRVRNTAKFFNNYKEMQAMYGTTDDIAGLINEHLARALNVKKPVLSKEIAAMFNRLATTSLLRFGNFSYMLMNIISLPMAIPFIKASFKRQLGESEAEFQARIGAWGKLDRDGNLHVDPNGAFLDTLNTFQNDKKLTSKVLDEARERGWLSTPASILGKAFLNTGDHLATKSGRKFLNLATSLADKSEEVSKSISFMKGYRLGQKMGLPHESRMTMGKTFSERVIGSYEANNKPQLWQQAAGSTGGLMYTYTYNLIQQVARNFIAKDKVANLAGLVTQTFMFGAQSVPGFKLMENYFFPLGSNDDFYTAGRKKGYSDDTMRSLMYGIPSAKTNIDFSSKGDFNELAVPGTRTPVVFSTVGNLINGISETIDAIAGSDESSATRLKEIWARSFPVTPVRGLLNAWLGYKTDKYGKKIIDSRQTGNALWWVTSVMNFRTLDESRARTAHYRSETEQAYITNKVAGIRKTMLSAIRGGEYEAVVNGLMQIQELNGTDTLATGYLKKLIADAQLTRNETEILGKLNTSINAAKQANQKRLENSAKLIEYFKLRTNSIDSQIIE